ncbi:GerAB/ArcD/ProY family transporter [Virgibacillus halophilus]|uniref:GerAB/ArcD/ProY family transporter n=1 Tax=Tigheibacillus halophilus TaxID=361280 RepID=UPI00362D9300
MKQSNGKIGMKEYIAIVVFMIGAKIADDTPSLFFKQLDNAAWMSPLINGLAAILPIALFIKVLTLYKGMNLAEITCRLLGNFIGKIVLFFLWAILFSAIVLDSSVYSEIITSTYFPNSSTFLVLTVLIGVCAYIGKKGIEQIGSVSWALFPYVETFFVLALALCMLQGNFDFLFPFFGPSEWTVIKNSVTKGSVFADFTFILLIAPAVKNMKDLKKGTWISFGIILVEAAIALASYVLLFDYHSVKMMSYPFHESIFYVEFGFLTNVEILIFPFWLVGAFIRFAAYLYLSAILLGNILGIKNFEYIIPVLAALTLLCGMILPITPDILNQLRELELLAATPVFFLYPVLLFVIAKWRGEKRVSSD